MKIKPYIIDYLPSGETIIVLGRKNPKIKYGSVKISPDGELLHIHVRHQSMPHPDDLEKLEIIRSWAQSQDYIETPNTEIRVRIKSWNRETKKHDQVQYLPLLETLRTGSSTVSVV